jgi:hypothetical protein
MNRYNSPSDSPPAALGIPKYLRERLKYLKIRLVYYKDEIVSLSRAFLEACLEEKLSQKDPLELDSRQREFLELVASSATFSTDAFAVPKELLEAFLEQEVSSSTLKHRNIGSFGDECV